MESNRDGAEQCLAKAFAALKQGDVEKARRMTSKSIRMFETEKAVTLLKVFEISNFKFLFFLITKI